MTEPRSTHTWEEARSQARDSARLLEPVTASLDEAVGAVLAEPLLADQDIPAFDAAADDGWAISGIGPWRIRAPTRRDLLGGFDYHEPTSTTALREGQAAPVTAGEPLGDGVSAVLALSRGKVEGDLLLIANNHVNRDRANRDRANRAERLDAVPPSHTVPIGIGIRARGSDAGRGSELLGGGERVTPAVVSLAATAGHDELRVIPMPTVALIRIGENVVDTGDSRASQIRDTVSQALAGWITRCNARCQPQRWVTGGDGALIDEIDDVLADIVIATGPSSGGAVRRVLAGFGVTPLIDGVACQPGRSSLLAVLPNGRPLIHCDFGPAEALATLVTLLVPLIEGMTGQETSLMQARFDDAVAGDRRRTTLVAVRYADERGNSVMPVRPAGPGGLFGLSQATALAVIPVGGVRRHETVQLVPMP